MLKIYGSDLSSPANKIRFVANYLEIKYEYVFVNLRNKEHLTVDFLKINPIGKIPAIDDDGFCLFESNAICRYLADKHQSNIYPKGVKERAIVDSWIDFGSMHVGMAMSKVVYNRIFVPIRKIEIDERSVKDGLEFLARFLPNIDKQLSVNRFIVGDSLTLADFNVLAILDPAEMAQIDISLYKHICRWRNDLKKQNFYTQCHQKYGESLRQSAQ